MNDLIPRQPKRKRQPTAALMRQQLALAADEIIRLRARSEADYQEAFAILRGERDDVICPKRTPWWLRLIAWLS